MNDDTFATPEQISAAESAIIDARDNNNGSISEYIPNADEAPPPCPPARCLGDS